MFDFKFATANAVPVKRTNPNMLVKQTFYVFENPHIPLLPPYVLIIIPSGIFYAIHK
jgi:hypothetical protein